MIFDFWSDAVTGQVKTEEKTLDIVKSHLKYSLHHPKYSLQDVALTVDRSTAINNFRCKPVRHTDMYKISGKVASEMAWVKDKTPNSTKSYVKSITSRL